MPTIDEYGNIVGDPDTEFGGFELGELDLQGFLIEMGLAPPAATELAKRLYQEDPRITDIIGQQMQDWEAFKAEPSEFTESDVEQFHKLISGDFWTDEMSGSFRDRIRRMNKPYHEEAAASLAARGLGTSGGEQAALMGEVASREQEALDYIAAEKFLEAIGLGTSGLSTKEQLDITKAQTAFGMGSDIRNYIDTSQLNRYNIGLALAQLQQTGALDVLGMSEGLRTQRRQNKLTVGDVIGGITPFASYFMPGAGGGLESIANIGQSYGSGLKNQYKLSQQGLEGLESPYY